MMWVCTINDVGVYHYDIRKFCGCVQWARGLLCHERFMQHWASLSEEEERKKENHFACFASFLVRYFRNAFLCHWESFWSWITWRWMVKAYKLTVFERFFLVFSCITYPGYPYRHGLYDTSVVCPLCNCECSVVTTRRDSENWIQSIDEQMLFIALIV